MFISLKGPGLGEGDCPRLRKEKVLKMPRGGTWLVIHSRPVVHRLCEHPAQPWSPSTKEQLPVNKPHLVTFVGARV